MKIVVATPTANGLVEARMAMSVLDFIRLSDREGCDTRWMTYAGVFVHVGRSHLIEESLRREADGILFWDSDTIASPAEKILDLVRNHPIATAAVRDRHDPARYAVFEGHSDGGLRPILEESGLVQHAASFEVAACGAALLWISREVLVKLRTLGRGFWPPFVASQAADGSLAEGEDIHFSRVARTAGYPIVCDPSIRTGHVGSRTLWHAPNEEN